MLTDKALTDFNKWLENGNHTPWVVFFDNLPDTVKNAYYIEWFDTVGVYVGIVPISIPAPDGTSAFDVFIDFEIRSIECSRFKATKQALIMANGIYNSKR